jgi:sugar (pentulose or hexulose) kinase
MTKKEASRTPEQGEQAMIEGILEGSPDAVGVAVIRLNCGCRKMAAVSAQGEPASKIIMYRDQAESICDQCREDNGDYMRVTEQFIHWNSPAPDEALKHEISAKVLGTTENHPN